MQKTTDIIDEKLYGILSMVSYGTGVPIPSIKSKTRKREVSEARQIFCLCAKTNANASLKKIGTIVNYKDHTGTKNAIDTAQVLYETIPIYKEVIDKVNAIISRRFTIKRIKIRICSSI